MEFHVPVQVREYFQEHSKIMTNKCFLRCPVWEQANHHFPNHKKSQDRFKAWVEAIGRKLETDADYEYFRKKRLCHIHFEPIFCYGDRHLSPLAVPTLHLTKESRAEYWAKDLEIRKSIFQQSKLHKDEIVKDEIVSDEIIKNEIQYDEIPKDQVETSTEEPVMDVPKEKLISNDTQSLLNKDTVENLVNSLIADVLNGEGENNNDIDSVQEQPMRELSIPSPVETNTPNPVAEIIIQYLPTTEVSIQNSLITDTSTDNTTSEVIENLQPKLMFTLDMPADSSLLEACIKDIEKKLNIGQNRIKPKRKKRNSKYGELSWESSLRIRMEHNYSKASKVPPSSHLSSNGVHPIKIIRTLKSKLTVLRKQLKMYKTKYKELLQINQQTDQKKIEKKGCKKITRISQKGLSSRKKVITYLNLRNVGGNIVLS